MYCCVFFFKQKTAYEMRMSDWSSDVCSSDLTNHPVLMHLALQERAVDIDLFLHLPIRRVQARFQQTDLILISEGRGRIPLREFLSTRVALCADLRQIGLASCRSRVCQSF